MSDTQQILELLLARAVKVDTTLDDHDKRLAALENGHPPPGDVESPDLTTVPPALQIVDAAKDKWTIVNRQVAFNGSVIANTHNVDLLKYCLHPVAGGKGGVYQQANPGGWWGPMTPTGAGVPNVPGDPSVPITPPPPGGVPAEAAKVGFNVRTFGPDVNEGQLIGNWFYINGGRNTKNPDGSLTIAGGPGYSDNLQTMILNGPGRLKGIAFGGGMFVRIVMKYTGPPPFGVPCPAFWFNDWENQDQGAYGTGASQWPGMPQGYVDSLEWDMGEINNGHNSWGFTIHNWYSPQSQIKDVAANTYGSPAMNLNAQDGNFHTYDGLWMLATASSQGYCRHWFDGRPVGSPIAWNKYDPNKRPPPVPGDNAWSRMDVTHHYGILGTGAANPMTVKEFSVWQASAANNKTGS